MKNLSPTDAERLKKAKELHEAKKDSRARKVLETISDQTHPEVLRVKLFVTSGLAQWEDALVAGRALLEVEPDDMIVWLMVAGAEVESGKFKEGYENLITHFGVCKIPSMHYLMIVCACQLNRLEDARNHLADLIRLVGEGELLKLRNDPKLAALWTSQN